MQWEGNPIPPELIWDIYSLSWTSVIMACAVQRALSTRPSRQTAKASISSCRKWEGHCCSAKQWRATLITAVLNATSLCDTKMFFTYWLEHINNQVHHLHVDHWKKNIQFRSNDISGYEKLGFKGSFPVFYLYVRKTSMLRSTHQTPECCLSGLCHLVKMFCQHHVWKTSLVPGQDGQMKTSC